MSSLTSAVKWCTFEWDGNDGERYRCAKPAHPNDDEHAGPNGEEPVQ
jgi:hypothetical protein